jgi:SAM-dependent methyltransferase
MTARHLPMTPTRLFGRLMLATNKPAYQQALSLVALPENGALLEVGFGPGGFLDLLLQTRPDVRVAGVDPTAEMVEMAKARKVIKRAGNRVDLRQASAVDLQWPDQEFHCAVAVHSFQFWSPPDVCAREVFRVLKPGGRLVLILRDHSRGAPDLLPNPISRGGQDVEGALALLEQIGLTKAKHVSGTSLPQAVVAVKPN